MAKKWSKKYKRSIDCNNPKGFSQKAHCAGRKKKENVMSSKLEELVGKPITEEQFDEAAGKKDACYYKVKARYDVWPSAYASGALVKCRKVGAANWGNKSKKNEIFSPMDRALKQTLKDPKSGKEVTVGSIKNQGTKRYSSSLVKKANAIFKKAMEKERAAKAKVRKMRGEGIVNEFGLPPTMQAQKKQLKNPKTGKMVTVGSIMNQGTKTYPSALVKKAKAIYSAALERERATKKKLYGKSKYSFSGKKEDVNEKRGTCWVGYQQLGMKRKGGKMVPNCVKEIYYEENGKGYGYTFELPPIQEAEYQGRKVKLNKIMQGDKKKFKVYVKNPKGNVVKVNFGQGGDAKGGTMRIRKSNPEARKSFRARHNCDNPGPKHKARYWSCRKW